MPSTHINKSAIDKLTSETVGCLFWDDVLRGFGVRVLADGSKSYVFQYRTAGGRSGGTKRHTIGRHGSPWTAETARVEAKRLAMLVAQGRDPAGAKKEERRVLTVSELCERYLMEGVAMKTASTLATDRGRIDRHIKPLLGNRRINQINGIDIENFLKLIAEGGTRLDEKTRARGRSIVRGGKGTASRTVGLLGGIFSFAERLGLMNRNPVHGVKRYRDKKMERFLSGSEFGILARALNEARAQGANEHAINIIWLLIFTGARKGEIETLRWSEVDFHGRRLKLGDSKTGAKNLPLNTDALLFLQAIAPAKGTPDSYVFPATKSSGYFLGTSRVWNAVREAADLGDVRLHDLRHSFASMGISNGVSSFAIGKILGHADQITTQRYTHLKDDPIAAAAESIGVAIREAIKTTPEQGAPEGPDS